MTRLVCDIETTGLLDNLMERIICICVHDIDINEIKSFYGEDESKILEDFFTYLNNKQNPHLIFYNGDSFDIPFIVRRAVVYKKRFPIFVHSDLRKIANGFKYSYNRNEKGRLRDWAAVLGLSVNTSPGSEMFKLYSEKKFDEIKNHCIEDLELTTKLYEHCDAAGLINGGTNSNWK